MTVDAQIKADLHLAAEHVMSAVKSAPQTCQQVEKIKKLLHIY